jgi:hypothetical protein
MRGSSTCGQTRLRFRTLHERAAQARRMNGSCLRIDLSLIVRAGDRRCNRPILRSRATRHIKRLRFEHSPPDIGHAPRNALSRCSATDPVLRGLARRWVLPSCRRATLMGFNSALRRLAPALGGRSSLIARAHVPVRPSCSPRFVFVGCSASLNRKRNCARSDWLLGFDSCLRSVSRSDCEARREIVPALGFASCRGCGHFRFVHSDGIDPVRIAKPQGP